VTRAAAAPIDAFGDVTKPCAALARRDQALRRALKAIGEPHIRRRPGGFEGLFRIIVEQQVSVPSAQAIWSRCRSAYPDLAPAAVLKSGEAGLKAAGLSGPKARYVIALAEAADSGAVDLCALPTEDMEAGAALQALKGIGPWTAAIYLLFCEGRIDIWPPNDVALKHAYNAAAKGALDQRALDELAVAWSPWRGLAAHILWTYYAHLRGRTPI
jgi:DNA-3-methyladenine glycosylase II